MTRRGSTQLYDYDGNLALNSRHRQNSSIEYYQNKQYRHHSSNNLSENTNKGKISAYSNMLSKRAESVNREINFLKKKQERLQHEIDKLENGENKENAYVQEQIDELNAELQRVSKQIAEDAKTVISLGISAGTGGGASSDTSTQGGGSSASAGRGNDAGGSSKSNNNASNSHTGVSNNPKRKKQIDSFLEKKEKLDKITSITGNPVGIVNAGISKTGRKVSKFGKDAEESASGNVNYDPQKHAQQYVQNTFKKLNDTRRQTNSAVIGIATLVGGPLGGLIAFIVTLILSLIIGAVIFFSILSTVGSSTQALSDFNNNSAYTNNSDSTDYNSLYDNLTDIVNIPIREYFSNGEGRILTVPYINQGDYKVDITSKYPGKTIARAGCGFCTMAMAISAFNGKLTSPVEITQKYGGQYYVDGYGISHSAIPAIANGYGISAKACSASDRSAIYSCLENGGLVVIWVHKQPFTASGHTMLLRGVNPSHTQFYIASSSSGSQAYRSSGRDINCQTWPVDTIFNALGKGGETVYLLSK